MSKQTYATVEEAQARIIELEEALTERTNERDVLSQNNESLTHENESLRALNQKYFNKLSAQFQDQDEDEDEGDPVPSCEDYAKTITI